MSLNQLAGGGTGGGYRQHGGVAGGVAGHAQQAVGGGRMSSSMMNIGHAQGGGARGQPNYHTHTSKVRRMCCH